MRDELAPRGQRKIGSTEENPQNASTYRSISGCLDLVDTAGHLPLCLRNLNSQHLSDQALTEVHLTKRDPSPAAVKWANEEMRKMRFEEKMANSLLSVLMLPSSIRLDAFVALKRQIEATTSVASFLSWHGLMSRFVLVNRMQQLARYPLLISAGLESGAGSV